MLKPILKSRCTCTELFIIQYSYAFSVLIYANFYDKFTVYAFPEYYSNTDTENLISICANSSLSFEKCNFPEMLRKFDIQQANKTRPEDDDDVFMFYFKSLAYCTRIILNKYINLIF